jgi:hypothetical protein
LKVLRMLLLDKDYPSPVRRVEDRLARIFKV